VHACDAESAELDESNVPHAVLDATTAALHLLCLLHVCAAAAVSHFVAYETDEMMVDDPGAIAVNYRWEMP
jgi:hypothetical protein